MGRVDEAALRALEIVEQRARSRRVDDEQRLKAALVDGGVLPESTEADSIDETLIRWSGAIRERGRLTVNFHPDRLLRDGTSVAEGLLRSGRYRPQSETGLSNGGRSAVPGGERTRWEQRLFGDTYDPPGVVRPAYGALDLGRDPHGGSPRFGSCYLVLDRTCLDRATFCVGDSHANPADVGTLTEFHPVAAGLLEQGLTRSGLDRNLGVPELVALLDQHLVDQQPVDVAAARSLDGYIEAQVHGGLSLAEDVVAIVVDPSFKGSETERHLRAAAAAYQLDLAWHSGSEIHVDEVFAHFTRPDVPNVATQVAKSDGTIDAAALGHWAARIPHTPPTTSGDAPDSDLQLIKYLWHCLFSKGRPG